MLGFDDSLLSLAEEALAVLEQRHYTLATAESCTGGLIAGCLTSIPGSSSVVDRGFVTYSNESKAQILLINPDMLIKYGSVSRQVASAMAYNARRLSRCSVGLSVTGIAGPSGGTEDKPVGLVYLGLSVEGHDIVTREEKFGDIGRDEVRLKTVNVALHMLLDLV